MTAKSDPGHGRVPGAQHGVTNQDVMVNVQAPEGKQRPTSDHQPVSEPRKFTEHADWSVSYTVRPEDTLAGVARDAYRHAFGQYPDLDRLQETMTSIMVANNLRLLRLLPGQQLYWDRTFGCCD